MLVVNPLELRNVAAGVGVDDSGAGRDLVARLLDHSPRAVFATLGAEGALLGHEHQCVTLPTRPAAMVDTTGAGDATVGALAAALAGGLTLQLAAAVAVAAGTAATTAPGPQPPLPVLAELRESAQI